MAVAQGAALAVANLISVEDFVDRGAAIGCNVQGCHGVNLLLDCFVEVSDRRRPSGPDLETKYRRRPSPLVGAPSRSKSHGPSSTVPTESIRATPADMILATMMEMIQAEPTTA